MKRIYLVEDDIKIAELLAGFLTKYDYSVTVSNDFSDITAECRKIDPDLINQPILKQHRQKSLFLERKVQPAGHRFCPIRII